MCALCEEDPPNPHQSSMEFSCSLPSVPLFPSYRVLEIQFSGKASDYLQGKSWVHAVVQNE